MKAIITLEDTNIEAGEFQYSFEIQQVEGEEVPDEITSMGTAAVLNGLAIKVALDNPVELDKLLGPAQEQVIKMIEGMKEEQIKY